MHGAVWTTAERLKTMTADLVGPTPKVNRQRRPQGVHSIEGCLQVGLRGGHVRMELAYVPEGVRVHKAERTQATEARRVVAQLSMSKSNRSGERTQPCGMPVSTNGLGG